MLSSLFRHIFAGPQPSAEVRYSLPQLLELKGCQVMDDDRERCLKRLAELKLLKCEKPAAAATAAAPKPGTSLMRELLRERPQPRRRPRRGWPLMEETWARGVNSDQASPSPPRYEAALWDSLFEMPAPGIELARLRRVPGLRRACQAIASSHAPEPIPPVALGLRLLLTDPETPYDPRLKATRRFLERGYLRQAERQCTEELAGLLEHAKPHAEHLWDITTLLLTLRDAHKYTRVKAYFQELYPLLCEKLAIGDRWVLGIISPRL